MACCQGMPHSTQEPYRLVINATPEEEELHATARGLAQAGKHAEACDLFEELVALNPDNPMSWNSLGNEYEATGHTDKAWLALKRGHEVDPAFPSILYNLGNLALDRCVKLHNTGLSSKADIQKMAVEAIGYFNDCLNRHPDYAECHYNIASAHRMNQDAHRASAHMTKALKLNPAFELPPGWRTEKART